MGKAFWSFCLLLLLAGCAQPPPKTPFAAEGPRAAWINERVKQVGYPKQSSVQAVTAALVKGLKDDHERMYAVYRWVSQNIEYDVRSYLTGNLLSASGAQHTFKTGVAVCDGFSDLVVEMGSHAGLEVVKVDGLAKGFGLVVTAESSQKPNHAWNAVKLDGRWHLMDATWDSGGVNAATRKFVRNSQAPVYFLADPQAFVSTHFPADARWQLLNKRVDFKTFAGSTQLPPQLQKVGLDASAHPLEDIRALSTPYRFHFGTQVRRVQAGLQQGNRAVDGNWSLLVWGADGRPDLLLSAPAAGAYRVSIYADSDPQATQLSPVLGYNMVFDKAGELKFGFPLAYGAYYARRVQLAEPLSGRLGAGASVRFKLRVGDAHKAALFQNNVFLKELDLRDGYFLGDAAAAVGQLSIGVMAAGESMYQMVLGYQVANN
jgi:hypothetical protein